MKTLFEVAQLAGVAKHKLTYWVNASKLPTPERHGGVLFYADAEVPGILNHIKELQGIRKTAKVS